MEVAELSISIAPEQQASLGVFLLMQPRDGEYVGLAEGSGEGEVVGLADGRGDGEAEGLSDG